MGTNGVAVEAIAETLKGEDYHQQLSSLSPCTRGDIQQPPGQQSSDYTGLVRVKNSIRTLFQWILKEVIKKELITLLRIAVPISLTLVFQFGLLWVSLLFVGHLPNRKPNQSYQYDAAGLGNSFLNITGVAIGNGVATAADTLCSQAYGYKNYKRVGIILQRGILIIALFLFPIWALWLNTESLLLLSSQDPCVAKMCSTYVRLFIVALPFIFLQTMLQHYLQSQSIVWQFVMIGFISNVVSVILHSILIYGADLGFQGAVISLVISNMLPPLLVIAYVWFRGLHKQTWGGWSYKSLQEWGLFLKLAIPGLLMMVLEWWSFELVTFLAGVMGDTQLAANVVMFQVLVCIYMPSIGISIATSVRVGNELGAGNPDKAKRVAYTAVGAVLCLCVVIVIFLLSTKDVIATIFISGNEEVVKIVSTLVYPLSLFIFTDQTQIVIGGVLRGSGRQYIGAIMNFVSYFVLGIPIGVLLAFKADLELLGIWFGLFFGNIVHCAVFLVVLWRTNWKEQSDKATKRASGESNVNDEHNKQSDQHTEETEELPLNDMERPKSQESDTSSISSNDSTRDQPNMEDTTTLLSDDEHSKNSVHTEVLPHKPLHQLKTILLHGSFYVVGLALLIAGGVGSRYIPYVDPDLYTNCSSGNFSVDNFDNSSWT